METTIRKLNLGCGFDIRPGYLNVDMNDWHKPDLLADITKLDMLPSGEHEEIVAQDVLEHLERHKVQGALDEWARLLAGGGVIHIRVPSLEHMFKLLFRPENRPAEKAAQIIHLMYGTQAYTGDYHLSGFTAAVLEDHLKKAGLQVCHASIRDEWMFDVTARKCEVLEDPKEFIHQMYFHVLGRPADPGGVDGFVRALEGGQMRRDQVAGALEGSEEWVFLKTQPSYLLGQVQKPAE